MSCPLFRTLFVIALFLGLVPVGADAQSSGVIRGTVTDGRSLQPIRGLHIVALGTRSTAMSDASGRFALPALPEGSYTLRFQWLGYKDQEVTVDVAAGETSAVDIVLEPEPLQIGEILVTTASRRPERVVESAAAVATVSPARVRDLAATGQAPLLVADLPGVHLMQSGVNSFNVNVRAFNGLVNRRLLVLVDGRDVSAPIVGSMEWPDLNIGDYGTRVELVRGPGSALYGANAFSGVLNILTPSVRQAPGDRLTLVGGELSTSRVDARHARVSSDLRWGYSVQGNYSRSSSWDRSRTNPGDLANEYRGILDPSEAVAPAPGYEAVPLSSSPLVTAGGSARVEHYLADGGVLTAEGGFAHLENQVSATGASRSQVGVSSRPWARLAWADDQANVMAYYTARGADQMNMSTGQVFEDWSSRAHVEAQTTTGFLGERGRATLGGSARREVVDSKGSVLAPEYDGRADEFYALFGHGSLELVDGLKVILSGRVDEASLFDARFAPKAGLVWMPTESQAFRVTWGYAYLMPSATDRFVRFPLGPPADLSPLEAGLRASALGPLLAGVAPGTLFTQSAAVPALAIGDEKRSPEEVRALEFGYKGQFDKVFFSADVHRSLFADFATSLLPGIHPRFGLWTAPAAIPEAYRGAVEAAVGEAVPGITRLEDGSTGIVYSSGSAGRATQWGLDLSTGVQISDAVRMDANYSYVTVDFEEGSFLGGDSIPTNTPTHSANASVTYTGVDDLRVRLGITLVDRFAFQSALFEGPVPAHQTVDVNVGYRLSHQASVSLSVTNLFDQRRYHYFGGSIIGRRALVALTWEP